MRYEGHGWDLKGPASVDRARAALDRDGAVLGYVFESKGFSRVDIDTNEGDPVFCHGSHSRRASGKGKPNSKGMARPWNHWGRGGKWPTAVIISATRLSMSV